MIIRLQNEKAELLYENQLLKNKNAELEKQVKDIDALHRVSCCGRLKQTILGKVIKCDWNITPAEFKPTCITPNNNQWAKCNICERDVQI